MVKRVGITAQNRAADQQPKKDSLAFSQKLQIYREFASFAAVHSHNVVNGHK